MQLIREEKLNRKIKKEFRWSFEIKRAGFYGIEVTASAKSWWQNFLKLRSFLKDDDLTLKIDNLSFPKKSGKRGLFDSEVAWNGNNLKGLKKTDFFIIKLDKGEHVLQFLADEAPKIEIIMIFQIKDKEISYLPKENYPIQENNGRQWLTIIFCNLKLDSLRIKASAKEGNKFFLFKRDDSDLKLIINGEIQRNQEEKSHEYWYWCGRTLKGKSKEFYKQLDLPPVINYVEFYADRNPEIEEIKIKFSESIIFSSKDVQTYTYKGVSGGEDYNRFNEVILRAVNRWNEHFFSQEEPPPEPLEPNLVKAMIYVESRMGYYQAGEGYYPAYPDVMQVADSRNPAIHTLNNDGWIDPRTGKVAREHEIVNGKVQVLDYKGEVNDNTPKESIKWGVRWLYHKAQGVTRDEKRYWLSWEEAVINYHYKGDKEYQRKVYKIYKDGLTEKGIKLWSILFISILIAGISLGAWVFANQDRVYLSFEDIKGTNDYKVIVNIKEWLWPKRVELTTTYANAGNSLAIDRRKYTGAVWWDLTNDQQEEIVITGEYLGDIVRYILIKDKSEWKIVYHSNLYGATEPAFSSYTNVIFKDINNDGKLEPVEEFYIPSSNAPDQVWRDYYLWERNNFYRFTHREKISLEKFEIKPL